MLRESAVYYSLFFIYVCRQFSISNENENENVITRNRENIKLNGVYREWGKCAPTRAASASKILHIENCSLIHIKLVYVCAVRMCATQCGLCCEAYESANAHTLLWRPPLCAHRVCFICSNFSQYLFTYLHFEFAFDMVQFFSGFCYCGSPTVFNLDHFIIFKSL